MPDPIKSPCPLCNGAEVIYPEGNDTDAEPCRCLKARLLRQHMGPEIASAPTLMRSPLLRVEKDEITLDRTKDNLWIKAPWVDVLPHLKWVFYCKGLRFRFRVVTDEKIRTVFVGNESYMARPKSKREDVATINSLADLVGSDYDLLIVRLGFLGHKNVAAPGAFKESLMIREVACLPTWIVETPSSPFGPGHFTYSDDVGDYLETRFHVINLMCKDRPVIQAPSEPVEDVSLDTDPSEMPVPMPAVTSRFQTPLSAADDDMVAMITGTDRKSKYGKKKSRGGGPV